MKSTRRRGLGLTLALARGLLLLYPRRFRTEHVDRFVEAAEHLWLRESDRERRGATRRTIRILLLDTIRAAPAEWLREVRGMPGGLRWSAKPEQAPLERLVEWMRSWGWDAGLAARGLLLRPRLSLLVIGMLAIGLGANTAIFSVLDRVVLRPIQVENGDRLVYVLDRQVERGWQFSPSQSEYERWKERARTIDGMEAFQAHRYLWSGFGDPRLVHVTWVSLGMADFIGAEPVIGRSFLADDVAPDAAEVVMIDEDFWRSAFGADPDVIGRRISLEEVDRTVIGVWPRDARFQLDVVPAFLTPMRPGSEMQRSNFSIALARVAEGIEVSEMQAELSSLLATLEAPATAIAPVAIAPYTLLDQAFVQGIWILFFGVGTLLVVAALNAASLLLKRAVDRGPELGLRMALGGGRPRLLRHFALESGFLAAIGVVVGLLLARHGTVILASLAPTTIPEALLMGGSDREPVYAALLVALVTTTCLSVPAIHLRATDLRRLMDGRSGSESHPVGSRLRSLLVVGQVAAATILVVGSGLVLNSVQGLSRIDLGFDADHLALVELRLPESSYPTTGDRGDFYQRAAASLASLPGLSSLSVTWVEPLRYSLRGGEPVMRGDDPRADVAAIFSETATGDAGFFETVGVPVVEGRDFSEAERVAGGDASVILVNEAFARRYPGSVLGREIRFPSDSVYHRIVGVVGNVRHMRDVQDDGQRVQLYYPPGGTPPSGTSQRFLLRADGEPGALLPLVSQRIRQLDPNVGVTRAQTGADLTGDITDEHRFLATLLTVLAILSLLLALGGVYGTASLNVSRRKRELGVRMALGAASSDLVFHVLGAGLRHAAIGVAAGALLASVLARFASGILYEVAPVDPASFAAGIAILLSTAAAACALPANRAARVAPADVMRDD